MIRFPRGHAKSTFVEAIMDEYIEKELDNMAKIHVLKDEKLGGVEREFIMKRNDFGEIEEFKPTDIVHIDGKRYRMADRKAEVGEIVIQSSAWMGKNGEVSKVVEVFDDGSGINANSSLSHDEYRVLEPIETPQSTDDVIANLVRRVSELERRLDGAKDDIETWSREIESVKYANERLGQTITLDVDTLAKLIGGAR